MSCPRQILIDYSLLGSRINNISVREMTRLTIINASHFRLLVWTDVPDIPSSSQQSTACAWWPSTLKKSSQTTAAVMDTSGANVTELRNGNQILMIMVVIASRCISGLEKKQGLLRKSF